jgi:hypothetical protein
VATGYAGYAYLSALEGIIGALYAGIISLEILIESVKKCNLSIRPRNPNHLQLKCPRFIFSPKTTHSYAVRSRKV